MKRQLPVSFALLSLGLGHPADAAPFEVRLDELSAPELPALQSFVTGQDSLGRWLLIGGRTDGLHRRRPFESFLASENNRDVFVVDPATWEVWSASLDPLPTELREPLQSTNMEFEQVGDRLYLIGGYAYSAVAGDHITFPTLTAVDVTPLTHAVVADEPIASCFRQITDERFAVTGGYLDRLEDTFFLVGGQTFTGRYNPMGPNHGPGFVQTYTHETRTFDILDDGRDLSIRDYAARHDCDLLHRRDFNLVPQIFPDGGRGFTAFSGVFRHDVNLPWFNAVHIDENGYREQPDFEQRLSQYHSATLPIYDSSSDDMYTLFFGGISQYEFVEAGDSLVGDERVPFVDTVSLVTHFADGHMEESGTGISMPGRLGTGAAFIPLPSAPFDEHEVLDLAALSPGGVSVGFIFGGIESSRSNVFFTSAPDLSWASDRVFRVVVTIGTADEPPARPVTGGPVTGGPVAGR